MVLLEVLISPPTHHLRPPRSWVKGHGQGDRAKLRPEMVSLHPHPLALGPLPGRPWAENQSPHVVTHKRIGRDHAPGGMRKEKAEGGRGPREVGQQAGEGKGKESLFQVTRTVRQVTRFQC